MKTRSARKRLLPGYLVCIPACSTFVLAQSAIGMDTSHTPWTGGKGVQETTARLMAREDQLAPASHVKVLRPRLRGARENLLQDFDSPKGEGVPRISPSDANPPAESPVPVDAQTVGFSFTAATLADASGFPPDSMGAAGPTQFLVVINGRVRTFNKTTGVADGVLNTTTDNFFSSVMTPPISSNFTTDPRVRYDRLSGRWFVIMIDVPGMSGTSPNRVMLAVSDSGAITAGTVWTYFYFQQDLVSPAGDTGKFADYPTLGIDANALYIGVNIFGSRGSPSAFSNTSVFVVRKSSVLGGGPIVVTAFRSLIKKVQGVNAGPFAPQGVDNYDPLASEGYIIGVDVAKFGKLQLRRIANPGGTPTISGNIAVTTAASAGPITVPHLGNTAGSSGNLDGLDDRLLAAHLRNGRLWTTQNIGVDNNGSPTGTITRNAVRWYELEGIASGQTLGVVQSGTVFQQSNGNTTDQRNFWMGTIMVSGQGHAAMGFSVAGANEHINAGTAWRLAGDLPGTMQTPVLYTSSAAAYNPPGDPGGAGGRRWGDFSYTSLDPNDDMTLWTIQEFCDSLNSYGVRVARLLAPPPAIPLGCNPSSVPAGASNVDLVVSGSSAGGAGFFDPGPGFPDHIAAVVDGGGVTVNHVTYSDPVHLTLNVTVVPGAVAGSRTITVTNPDGQSATSSSGPLAIVGGGATNTPPTVAITSPTNNTTFTAPANISVTADASDKDGIVNKVEFFGGAINLGESTSTPYSLVWSNVAAGSYTLTATATDNIGAVTISDPVTISVAEPVPEAVALVNVTADVSQVHFSFQTQSGVGYTVQFTDSLDPVDWQTLSVLNGNGSITNIADANLVGTERFYRVVAK